MIDKASEGDLSRYTDHLGDFGKMTDFVVSIPVSLSSSRLSSVSLGRS